LPEIIYIIASGGVIDHPCRFLNKIKIQGKGREKKNAFLQDKIKKKLKMNGVHFNECDIKGKYKSF
jgi:hypothetical protein